ncbi:MAG: nuclear transport factor 2 family protein [Bacteroidia bacterium]|mgnify:CR=1 FL=1|nr:nuclear transport factor 2 family protein [Bacteroidia bacterium]HQV01128.1 nuclear transport factor 2 family protein [Bacteroidia bacterium]
MSKYDEIAKQWFNAFNTKNTELLLSLYDDNAQHFSPKLLIARPETKGLVTGKAAMRDWWQQAFDTIKGLNYELLTLVTNEQHIFFEYIRHADDVADLRVGELLEIRNGLIVSSRVFHG